MNAELVPSALAECEAVIERGIGTFVEVGTALMRIRDERLYRTQYVTFEIYCRERWAFTDRHARRLMDAAEVAGLIETGPIGPVNEAQARELAPFRDDPIALRSVAGEIVERSRVEGTPITAAAIRTVVRDRLRGMAAESDAELQAAASGWSDAQRAAFSPELLRREGEVMRLVGDIAALPDPSATATALRPYLPREFASRAEAALGWLVAFCRGLEGSR